MFFRRKKEKLKSMDWFDITVEQYQKLKGLDLTDISDQITAGEILLGINADNMVWKDFCKEFNKLAFMNEPLPETIIRDSYVLNGKKYNCLYNLQQMNVARYMDFTNIAKTGDIVKILGVFLVPDGKEYGDYDLKEVYEDIKTMSIVEAMGIFNFFKVQFIACIKTMKDYSVNLLKKDKKLQEMVSAVMDSFFTSDL